MQDAAELSLVRDTEPSGSSLTVGPTLSVTLVLVSIRELRRTRGRGLGAARMGVDARRCDDDDGCGVSLRFDFALAFGCRCADFF